jgi:hypothetical protein
VVLETKLISSHEQRPPANVPITSREHVSRRAWGRSATLTLGPSRPWFAMILVCADCNRRARNSPIWRACLLPTRKLPQRKRQGFGKVCFREAALQRRAEALKDDITGRRIGVVRANQPYTCSPRLACVRGFQEKGGKRHRIPMSSGRLARCTFAQIPQRRVVRFD